MRVIILTLKKSRKTLFSLCIQLVISTASSTLESKAKIHDVDPGCWWCDEGRCSSTPPLLQTFPATVAGVAVAVSWGVWLSRAWGTLDSVWDVFWRRVGCCCGGRLFWDADRNMSCHAGVVTVFGLEWGTWTRGLCGLVFSSCCFTAGSVIFTRWGWWRDVVIVLLGWPQWWQFCGDELV
jgi:hypothetical protein